MMAADTGGERTNALGLREEKKDWTRNQLLNAALTLMVRQGFEKTSIQEIAAAVPVSARTFLRYFPTKEDVIVVWVGEVMAVLPRTLRTQPKNVSAGDALRTAAREMLSVYDQQSEFLLVIERAIASSPTVSARKQEMIEGLMCEVSAIVKSRWHRRGDPTVLPDVYAGAIIAMIRATIRTWVETEGRVSPLVIFADASRALDFVCLKKAARE